MNISFGKMLAYVLGGIAAMFVFWMFLFPLMVHLSYAFDAWLGRVLG